jgi:hypothetical protein
MRRPQLFSSGKWTECYPREYITTINTYRKWGGFFMQCLISDPWDYQSWPSILAIKQPSWEREPKYISLPALSSLRFQNWLHGGSCLSINVSIGESYACVACDLDFDCCSERRGEETRGEGIFCVTAMARLVEGGVASHRLTFQLTHQVIDPSSSGRR